MHQIHMRPKKGAKDMPNCMFGPACTRSDCIYKHPPKKAPVVPPDAPICAPFVLGQCKFGKMCQNRHVSEEEAEKIRQRNAKTPCRFGSACTTQDCLFVHPPKEPCMYGTKCTNKNCVFAHPDPQEQEEVAALAAKLASAVSLESKPPAVVFPKSEALRKQEEEAALVDGGKPTTRHVTVRAPPELWVEDWRRNPGQYVQYANPYERLLAVNSISPKGVIDLHYQTVDQVVPVLISVLNGDFQDFDWEYYDEDAHTVWIVTGAGTHTVDKSRVLIYDVVFDYLDQAGFTFKVAKDSRNNAGGFLLTL